MLLVVIVHTLINSYGNVGQEMIRFFCLCYTMPLFTFISGWFSKESSPLGQNVRLLLVPCLLFTVINDLVMTWVNPVYRVSFVSFITPGFAMWYLWALFLYRISLRYLVRIPYIVLISFLLSWIVGFIPQIGSTMSLSRIFCFLPYFLLGYKLKNDNKYKTLSLRLMQTNVNGGALALIFTFWMLVILYRPGLTYATGFNYGYGNYPFLGWILRMALQTTILLTGYLVIRIFPNRELWFTKYGKRTMRVYLWHGLIVLPFAYLVFPPFGDAATWQRIAMIIVPTSLCIPLFFHLKKDRTDNN